MNGLSNKTITVTNDEFIMLSLLIGADRISGIPDESLIVNMNEDQLEKKWEEIKGGLIKKELLKEEIDEGVNIDEDIFNMIHSYNSSKRIVNLIITNKNKSILETNYYVGEGDILKCEFEGEKLVKLSYVTFRDSINIVIKYLSDLENRDVGVNREAVLEKSDYYNFMSRMTMGNIKGGEELLVKLGMAEDIAKDSVLGFHSKNMNISISTREVGVEDSMAEMMIFYCGKNYVYSIKHDEDNEKTTITAMSKNEAIENIYDFYKETILLGGDRN